MDGCKNLITYRSILILHKHINILNRDPLNFIGFFFLVKKMLKIVSTLWWTNNVKATQFLKKLEYFGIVSHDL